MNDHKKFIAVYDMICDRRLNLETRINFYKEAINQEQELREIGCGWSEDFKKEIFHHLDIELAQKRLLDDIKSYLESLIESEKES